MDSSIWIIAFAAAVALLIVLVAFALVRLSALLRRLNGTSDLSVRLASLSSQNERLERELRAELVLARGESSRNAQTARTELAQTLNQSTQLVQNLLNSITQVQNERLSSLTQTNEQRLEAVRATLEQRLEVLRSDNAQKLEQMRATVDEKLHATLEQRLGESFKQVSERLEQVHKGLGEMQTLAAGVGDLKKVLSNVKTRGTWGEVQLENLLEQILTRAQYDRNVATRPDGNERVEFAIRLPGRDPEGGPCWLPIDAKFPLADYQQLVEAQERGDAEAVELYAKALERRIKDQAADIHAKYVAPPHTTDFALLYLPVEGLYAEVLRRPGLADALQRNFRVTIAGPTTLAAMLNSLQMGFRTLAIEQRSSEVWKRLGMVKTEFARFGELLAATRKKLEQASNSIGEAEVRSRAIERQLRDVEALPAAEAERLLGSEPRLVYDADANAGTPGNDDEPAASRDSSS
ncbi:MAG TPA: DNA recombination protein RmuC [Casimicrobiaceae bacterium]|nr:DNA recombination protein RmuC [Casimicrobiaceae bacterium]